MSGAGANSQAGGGSGSSPLTTKGDLYTYSTADASLAIGTNEYCLIADSVATTGNKWGILQEAGGGTAQSTYTTGDLLYASASNTLSKLPVSSAYSIGPIIYDGSVPVWYDPTKYMTLWDDFITLAAPTTNGYGGNTNYEINPQNGGGTERTGSPSHPGVLGLQSGTNATGAVRISHGEMFTFGDGITIVRFLMQIPTISDVTDGFIVRVGFGNDVASTADYQNGAYFEYTDDVNSGNWTIKTANSSVRTTSNTSTAADTNWHLYEIVANAAGTSIAFFIDRNEVANSPITTNIPTSNLFSDSYSLTKTSGTTIRQVNLDYTWISKLLTSNRSP